MTFLAAEPIAASALKFLAPFAGSIAAAGIGAAEVYEHKVH